MKCEAETPQFSRRSSCSDFLGMATPGTGSVCLECGEKGERQGPVLHGLEASAVGVWS